MSKKKAPVLRRIKLKLYEQDPHCHYCGKEVILAESGVGKCSGNPYTATVDHVYSRFHLMRWVRPPNDGSETRHVLSCQKCNNERQAAEFEQLPLYEQAARCWGFKPRLNGLYSSLEEAYKAMRKIYIRYGVPYQHLEDQLSS